MAKRKIRVTELWADKAQCWVCGDGVIHGVAIDLLRHKGDSTVRLCVGCAMRLAWEIAQCVAQAMKKMADIDFTNEAGNPGLTD